MGVFGGPEVTRRVVMGLYSLQHRGQESVGVATTNGETIHLLKRMGLVTELNREEKAGFEKSVNAVKGLIEACKAIAPNLGR